MDLKGHLLVSANLHQILLAKSLPQQQKRKRQDVNWSIYLTRLRKRKDLSQCLLDDFLLQMMNETRQNNPGNKKLSKDTSSSSECCGSVNRDMGSGIKVRILQPM